MQRLLIGIGAMGTVAMALLTIGFALISLRTGEDAAVWHLARIAIAAAVIGVAALTVWHLVRPQQLKLAEPLLLIGAMGLLLVGSAGSVWSIYLGQVTGDFEYWVFPVNAALIVQGGLIIWNLWQKGRSA